MPTRQSQSGCERPQSFEPAARRGQPMLWIQSLACRPLMAFFTSVASKMTALTAFVNYSSLLYQVRALGSY